MNEDSIEHLFVYTTGADNCVTSYDCPNPEKFKKKGVIVLKLSSDKISMENVQTDLVYFEITKNVLEHCYTMFHDVIGPVI